MSKWTVHAGHNPDGKSGCGAVGLIKESTEARNVVNHMVTYLKNEKVTVTNCTVNDGKNQNDVLYKLGVAMNSANADFNVSVHFNSGANNKTGNGKTTGVEVLIYNSTSALKPHAERVCKNLEKLGYKNRGIKYNKSLYVLKHTTKPTMLIEICFVDDKDDTDLYTKLGSKAIAKAIVEAMLNKTITKKTSTSSSTTSTTSKKYYRVQCGSYKQKGNATKLSNKLKATGFKDCITVFDNTTGLYKVQVGAYSKKANATTMLTKLTTAGFNGFIVYS